LNRGSLRDDDVGALCYVRSLFDQLLKVGSSSLLSGEGGVVYQSKLPSELLNRGSDIVNTANYRCRGIGVPRERGVGDDLAEPRVERGVECLQLVAKATAPARLEFESATSKTQETALCGGGIRCRG
jgi:hypothetical protein